MSTDFDWTDSESVVIKQVAALAVYTNPAGELVIRQQGDFTRDEDEFVVVPMERAAALIEAIKKEAGIE